MALESMSKHQGRRPTVPQASAAPVAEEGGAVVDGGRKTAVKGTANEHLKAVHSSSGGDIAPDGGSSPCGSRRVQTAAGFCAPSGGVSNDSSGDVLSRCEPGRHVIVGHGTTGAAVWVGTGVETEGCHKFLRMLGNHAAIFARLEHRHR